MNFDLQVFLKVFYSTPFFYSLVFALITIMVLFRRLRGIEVWVAGVVILFALNEIAALILMSVPMKNIWLYNIMLIPQISLAGYVLLYRMKSVHLRQLMIVIGILIALFHVANLLWFQGIHTFASFTAMPAYLWLTTCSFYSLKNRFEDVDHLPFDSLVSWFALATLIDYVGSLPIHAVLGWTNFTNTATAALLFQIVSWLYVAWYFIITLGLLWTKTSLRSVILSR